MFIRDFYQQNDNVISFTRQQASQFAKEIADDFNPLHDINAKRFCVPGDLLFSVLLSQTGLYQQMHFQFVGMVTDEHQLLFPTEISPKAAITDQQNKTYVTVEASGERTHNEALITALIKAYVQFSGHTFPDILIELMKEHHVMINPTRPMIMYESMSINLTTLVLQDVSLRFNHATLNHDNKRGNACLYFDLIQQNEVVGNGEKHMLLSGLRPYCQQTIDGIVQGYQQMKQAYSNPTN
jgi:hypothetical protein